MALLRPEALLGLTGMDNLTHALFWSLLANAAVRGGVAARAAAGAREASQALLFVDVFERAAPPRTSGAAAPAPTCWRWPGASSARHGPRSAVRRLRATSGRAACRIEADAQAGAVWRRSWPAPSAARRRA
jgi:hypothetical protein